MTRVRAHREAKSPEDLLDLLERDMKQLLDHVKVLDGLADEHGEALRSEVMNMLAKVSMQGRQLGVTSKEHFNSADQRLRRLSKRATEEREASFERLSGTLDKHVVPTLKKVSAWKAYASVTAIAVFLLSAGVFLYYRHLMQTVAKKRKSQ